MPDLVRCGRCGMGRAVHTLPALYCPNPARPFDLFVAERAAPTPTETRE